MKSKVFKKLVREVADELDLPYNEVYDAVLSRYYFFRDEIGRPETRDVLTTQEYDKLPKVIYMKGLGSFTLNKERYVILKNTATKKKQL